MIRYAEIYPFEKIVTTTGETLIKKIDEPIAIQIHKTDSNLYNINDGSSYENKISFKIETELRMPEFIYEEKQYKVISFNQADNVFDYVTAQELTNQKGMENES